MNYNVRLLSGIFRPNIYLYQLQQAEVISGFWLRLVMLIGGSVLISALGGYYGLGSEGFSHELTTLDKSEFAARKLFFVGGNILWGFIYPMLMTFFPALFYWIVLEVNFLKATVMQLLVIVVLLVEELLLVPLMIFLEISKIDSPFALGVIVQYLTANDLIKHFAGTFSIFFIWVIIIQYKTLIALSEKSKRFIFLIVLGINIIIWVTSSIVSYLNIEKLI